MLFEKHWLLLWNCCVSWTQNKNHDECKKSSQKSVNDYENDESDALHCFWILVHHHLFVCNFINDLEKDKRRKVRILRTFQKWECFWYLDHIAFNLLGCLLSYDSNLSVCHHRNLETHSCRIDLSWWMHDWWRDKKKRWVLKFWSNWRTRSGWVCVFW